MYFIIFTLLCSAHIPQAQSWLTFERHQYLVVNKPITNAFMAEAACSDRGAHLVNIKSQAVYDFLLSNIPIPWEAPYDYFVGAKRNRTTQTFQWTDGSGIVFSQWATNEPNNLNGYEDCVTLTYSTKLKKFEWYDKPCVIRANYICQSLIPVPTQMSVNGTAATSTTISTKTASSASGSSKFVVSTAAVSESTTGNQSTSTNATRYNTLPGASSPNWAVIIVVAVACLSLLVLAVTAAVIWKSCTDRNKSSTDKPSAKSLPSNDGGSQPQPETHYEVPIPAPVHNTEYINSAVPSKPAEAVTYVNVRGDQDLYADYVELTE